MDPLSVSLSIIFIRLPPIFSLLQNTDPSWCEAFLPRPKALSSPPIQDVSPFVTCFGTYFS